MCLACEENEKKLKNEITRLESRLAIKKEMLLNMMRCKNASR